MGMLVVTRQVRESHCSILKSASNDFKTFFCTRNIKSIAGILLEASDRTAVAYIN